MVPLPPRKYIIYFPINASRVGGGELIEKYENILYIFLLMPPLPLKEGERGGEALIGKYIIYFPINATPSFSY
jgi:hypothetical protein